MKLEVIQEKQGSSVNHHLLPVVSKSQMVVRKRDECQVDLSQRAW